MSVWTMQLVGDRLKLTFTHDPLAESPMTQPCGEIAASAASDLEAWVIDQAAPWDLIETPGGLFVRQHPVAEVPPSRASVSFTI